MAKKYSTNYKKTIIIAGVVGFADCPIPHKEYNKLSLGLRITEKTKAKLEAFIKAESKLAREDMGIPPKVKARGAEIKEAEDKDGVTIPGEYFVTLKRNAEIQGKKQTITLIDSYNAPMTLESNIGSGSKVMVKAHLYFSHVQGFFNIRIEPQVVRIIELSMPSGFDPSEFEDAEEDFVSPGNTAEDTEDAEEEDEEDFV